jgi:hypothetical protein
MVWARPLVLGAEHRGQGSLAHRLRGRMADEPFVAASPRASAAPSLSVDKADFWRIEGYQDGRLTFERVISASAFTQLTMKRLLRTLAAAQLTPDQIIEASLRRNARGYAGYIEVRQKPSAARYTLTCGFNPRFEASVWTRDEIAGPGPPAA